MHTYKIFPESKYSSDELGISPFVRKIYQKKDSNNKFLNKYPNIQGVYK